MGDLARSRRRVVVTCLGVDGVVVVGAVVFDYWPVLPLLAIAAIVVGIVAGRRAWQAAVACAVAGCVALAATTALYLRYMSVVSGGTWDHPYGPDDVAVWGDGTRIALSRPTAFRPEDPSVLAHPDDLAYRFTVTVHNGGPTLLSLGWFHLHCLASGLDYPNRLLTDPRAQLPAVLLPGRTATATYAFGVPVGAFEPSKYINETPQQVAAHRLLNCYASPAGSRHDINVGITREASDLGTWAPAVAHDNAAWEFRLE